jgi:hypothetical protein
LPFENRVDIHDFAAAHPFRRDHLHGLDQALELRGHIRLDGANHHILAAFTPPAAFIEHAKGLSDSRRVAQEHFQALMAQQTFLCVHPAKELIGVRPAVKGAFGAVGTHRH